MSGKQWFNGFSEDDWAGLYQEAMGLAQQGNLSDAADAMKKVVEYAKLPGGQEQLVESYVGLGNLQMGMHRFELAEQTYTQAVDTARAARGPRDRLVAGAMTYLANCYEEQGRYDRSAETYGQAISILEAHPPGEEGLLQLLTNTRSNLASVLSNLGRGQEALALNQQVVEAERRGDGDPSGLAVALWTRSTIASRQGLHEEAVQASREALELAAKWNPPDSPPVFQAVHQYCNILVKAGRVQEAIPVLEEGLERLRTAGFEDPIFAATWMESLADALMEAGRFEESERWYQLSLEAFTRLHGPLHQNLVSAVEGYRELLRRQGRDREMREQERRLEEIQAALPAELVRRNARK
ncbi:tetratricopeptide repeat protein [Hyalangium gracile]|uniref:tetratricopeptide repeat protein n=1 Tax=Hyalangium gracile TaxID=394092 RepID=UPI00295E5AF0|nr:tetratricopeptide repeat protein [Hyalangium gracile]